MEKSKTVFFTSSDMMSELRLTRNELRSLLPASGEGVIDHSGRRFKAERSGVGRAAKWTFTEVERPPVAASAGGDDLAGMGSAELKEEKQRLECRLLRQRLKEEGEELKMQGAAAVTAEYQRRLDRLHDALAEVVHAPEDLARLRRLIKEIRD